MSLAEKFGTFMTNTPIGRQFTEHLAARALEERRDLVKALDAAREARTHEVSATRRRAADAAARRDKIRGELQAAEIVAADAQATALVVSASHDRCVVDLEARLRATSLEAIQTFLDRELVVLEENTRNAQAIREVARRTADGRRLTTFLPSIDPPTITRRLAAIRAARGSALELQLEVVEAGEVAARLDTLRASIPPLEPAAQED